MAATGRPSKFTEELFSEILERLAAGEPLSVICREEGKPHRYTVREWCRNNPDLDKRFQEAREDGHDRLADECLEIADDSTDDVKTDKNGNLVTDNEVVQRSKLRVWTRLQLLSKWSSRYGDKVAIDHNVTGNLADAMREARERATRR